VSKEDSGKLKITDIKPVQKDPSRVAIFVDDLYIGSLNVSRLYELRLEIGLNINEEQLNNLLEETEITKATLSSLNLLSYRSRSEDEIRKRLEFKGFSRDIINKVIKKLYNWEYLDDFKFANSWVKHRTERKKPYGSRYIRYELIKKGVSKETIDRVLKDIDEQELCLKAGKEALRRYKKKYEGQKLKEHLYGHLVRRGFPITIILDVLDSLLNQV
jgi:regulatory protein